ncbi:MBL fold metallo-hydrolase [Rhizobium leguminosarum]|jgi:glyoxylase-like metal-dependent hydrolase (beta-lactamase superfamily II)|uniref:MBL fold metallo-hydrolase n=3 Tax=Rhizobium/Agrobacterium group TaxID=227290 RepID=A0A8G2IWC7_RHILV|nr:MBL fold metallo-hydrolase [Rhizobium leguminosarum]NEI18933.1 MBL fold metallo-hydrolase [Rhizobium ruizarguesonis]NKK10833.1 MBL fold metallo-hydrolase [Rhizobium leguminosarum bv. viciae]NEI02809.1 MBL fold metallo-hydrolase [Rhizobium leguminosarum]NEJ18911.1 MBL fold metallo-hydrolase [Rhizobium leguminosarum]NKK24299.1 MBL fold metallo-hydrolase [Rhizobium leguminosarum bv. viciae]
MKTTLAAGATAVFAPAGLGHAAGSLTWKHFPAGQNGFFRAPVLVFGAKEAVLIDGGFTLPDGKTVADAIKATGKTLTTIYISQSDPDYYFSLGPIKAAFPDAKVIAASATVDAIKGSVEKKLAVWGPQLKENGPQTLADVVIPEAFDEKTLTVDGETIEIVDAEGLANRRYLFVPSLNAVFGGVLIFNGVHVWTADTNSAELRAAWVANLEKIAARKPAIVVAGHMTPDAPTDLSGVEHTIAYLKAFEEELAKTKDSAALKAAMEARFPGLGMGVALDIGAKVATGEMKWG